jgi:hypothetical protein
MLDLRHPRTAQVFRAARHLDALRALAHSPADIHPDQWRDTGQQAQGEIAALQHLSATQFAETSASAQRQLRLISTYFNQPLRPDDARAARSAVLWKALEQLERDFGTWAI